MKNDTTDVVIDGNFENGDGIPTDVQERISAVTPELKEALQVARLEHAPDDVVQRLAAEYGVDPSHVGAYAVGKTIYVPSGKGVRLATLTHEVTHVYQNMTVPNIDTEYREAYERNLKRRLLPIKAYELNRFEIQARRFARDVERAYAK